MGSAKNMINAASKSVGLGESGTNRNYITQWYGMNGQPWCNMAITYWAYHSNNAAAVCFNKKFAYTVAHAEEFKRHGQWIEGTDANCRRAKPGDIVFFDWGGSNSIGAIDHVGIVTSVSGGTVHTIEGNTSDMCLRRSRTSSVIAGFGRPKYGASVPPKPGIYPGYVVEKGDVSDYTKQIQTKLNALKVAKLVVDSDFGPATKAAVIKFQKSKKLTADGEVGPVTWKKLFG